MQLLEVSQTYRYAHSKAKSGVAMAGPTFTNPHLGTETEGGWAMGFSWGFLGPAFSRDPPLVIAPEQIDAFNEGVLAGQQAAIDGISIEPPCFSIRQQASSAVEDLMTGVHAFEVLGLLRSIRHFAHFTAEGLVSVFLFLIPGPPLLNPIQEFRRISSDVRDRLNELGLAANSLFIAAGIDEGIENCELLFTRVFTRLDAVRDAVKSLGREKWVIAQWDAAAPVSGGGFAVVESSAD
jgi:hypothetical protein